MVCSYHCLLLLLHVVCVLYLSPFSLSLTHTLSLLLAHNNCRVIVQWVCDFIEKQSQLKTYLHTKSLHTSIVAGFTTLIVWIMEHPHLMAHEVIQVHVHVYLEILCDKICCLIVCVGL